MSAALETVVNGSPEDGDYISRLTKDGPVELRAYGHQVGGHSLLMKFGKAICKPMLPREQFFYSTMPQELKKFTPVYYGVVSIRFKLTQDGRVHLLATGNGIENGHSAAVAAAGAGMGNGEMETWTSGTEGDGTAQSLTHPIVRLDFIKATTGFNGLKHEDIVKASNGYFSNPWSTACMTNMQSILAHFGATQLQDLFQDYLVLEDLTCRFERPCIMDLKMGTRRHGDDQSEEKKQRHMERCASTTSAQLGASMAGIQVYNASQGVYTFKDKYYCRELTPQGFHDELCQFVHSGFTLRHDVISAILQKLCQLRELILAQDTFRFFSSSLLIVYDGKLEENFTTQSSGSGELLKERAQVLEGVENFSELAGENKVGECVRGGGRESCEGGEGREGSEGGEGREGGEVANKPSFREEYEVKDHLSEGESGTSQNHRGTTTKRTLVDIRMIDFAHATHAKYKHDPVKYSGPDKGYVTGLNTLISAFQSMEKER